jgi:hypothetical protein
MAVPKGRHHLLALVCAAIPNDPRFKIPKLLTEQTLQREFQGAAPVMSHSLIGVEKN